MDYKIEKISIKDFPIKLKKIKKPPQELYAVGNMELMFKECFAIVGTRKISEYGIQNCKYFAKELALRNIITVSGMAIGTDTVVHEETIENGGKTIAVLGSGFNNIYPKSNKELFRKIVDNEGLILTEYQPNEIAVKANFPARNRIISALSEGVLIIEAAYRSGTSITAKHAIEQEKKVFAIPGIIGTVGGVGVNNLIKKGAILTTTVEDILRHYPQFASKKRIDNKRKPAIKKEYIEIYKILEKQESSIENIAMHTKINIIDLLQIITNMEIDNIVCQDNKGIYKLIERSRK